MKVGRTALIFLVVILMMSGGFGILEHASPGNSAGGVMDGGSGNTVSGSFWIDFKPSSDPHEVNGGRFEGGETSYWSIYTHIFNDDFDDTDNLDWASQPGIYSEIRNDEDLADGTLFSDGAWCTAAAEQAGFFPPEDSQGSAQITSPPIVFDEYFDTSKVHNFHITKATLYCDYKMWSDDFNDDNSFVYFYIGLLSASGVKYFKFEEHSGNSDAPSWWADYPGDGYCTDYWDPGDGHDDPYDSVDDYQVSEMADGQTFAEYLEELFETYGFNQHMWITFYLDFRLYADWFFRYEDFKFWVDDVKIKIEYEYEPRWTYMIYCDGDNNLEKYVTDIIKLIGSEVSSLDDVNVVVQLDRISEDELYNYYKVEKGYSSWRARQKAQENDYKSYGDWTICHRFILTEGMMPEESKAVADWGDGKGGREVNMGDPQTLIDFVTWATNLHPYDYYCLVLDNHGDGWRGAITDWSSSDDLLSLDEIKDALDIITNQLGKKIDILCFDACLMGMTEVLYALHDNCNYFVGSENYGWAVLLVRNGIPIGYTMPFPHFEVLDDLNSEPTKSPENLASLMVDEMEYFWNMAGGTMKINGTFSSCKTNRVAGTPDDPDLIERVNSFAKFLINWLDKSSNNSRVFLYAAAKSEGFYENIDLYNFAENIKLVYEESGYSCSHAENLMDILDDNVILNEWHGPNKPGAHGLSIYFPWGSEYNKSYSDISFASHCKWDEFIAKCLDTYLNLPDTNEEEGGGTAYQGSTETHSETIDSGVTMVSFYLSWSGSDLNLSLEDPNGVIIDPSYAQTDPYIHYTYGETFEKYCIEYPTPGTWKLRVYGADVPSAGEEYDYKVISSTGDFEHIPGYEGNSPPYKPNYPQPYDKETYVDLNADLSWSGGDPDGDPVTYDVYFGTTSPPPQIATGVSGTTYDPGPLTENTWYFWRIVAHDDHSHSTSGPIWSFSTGGGSSPSDLIVGDPKYGPNDEYVTSHTDFRFPPLSGNLSYWYRIWYGGSSSGWQKYVNPFYLSGECMHRIEFEIRINGNSTGDTQLRTFYVDDTPPSTSINIGSPYYTDGSTEWITPETTIALRSTDYPLCSPSGVQRIQYRCYHVNDAPSAWNEEYGNYVNFQINTGHYWGKHIIEWRAIDNLGHIETIHSKEVKVVIPLSMATNEWFLDGAHQDNPGYTFSQTSTPNAISTQGINWVINVDKKDPYSGLGYPSGFVDIYYNNQGMDWSQAESIDLIIKPISTHPSRSCTYPNKAKVTIRIDNPKNAWKHDLSTDSTKTGEYTQPITLNTWNTVTWNFDGFSRDNLKSLRLRMTQNDDDYASDGETLTFQIMDVLLAAPIGLDQGTSHPLADITTNTHDFTVTDTDGDWCFEHSIQHAVNWAKEGLTITVEEGTYYENVYMFRDNVILQKASNPVIDGQYLGPTVTLAADHLTINGFDIIHGLIGVYASDTENHNILNCNIHDNNNDGIYMDNSANHHIKWTNIYTNTDDGLDAPNVENLVIENSTFHDNTDDGIYLDNSQNHHLTNCDIYQNGHDGLHADTVSNTNLQTCDIHDNNNDGIYLHNSNNHNILNCLIYGNGDDGLDAPNVDTILIENTEIHDNGDNGAYMSNSQNHDLTNCDIYLNGHDGLHADTVSFIDLQTCNIHDNGNDGIYLHNSNNHNILNCLIYGNGDDGLDAPNVDTLLIENTEIHDNSDDGAYMSNSQNHDILNSQVHSNGHDGVHAETASHITITSSDIYNNQNHGVYLTDSHDHSLYNNYMYSNHEDGIHAENVINTEINKCIISGNNGNGIYLKDTSNNDINNCGISGNYNGIYGDGVSDTTIQNNEIHSSKNNRGYGGAGIMFISDTNGFFNNVITNNNIYDNARQGIFLGWYNGIGNPVISTNNQITHNKIHHNGLDETHPPDASRYGIQLANADNNLIENNEIYDHYQWNIGVPWGAGIYLWASYENQVKNNHIYRNDQQVRCWSEGSQRTPGPNYINYNYFCKQYDEPCISPVVGVANYDFDTTAVVDARYNWWKAPSGPSSPPDENNYDIITGRIADGLGSQVIGPVNFDPWAGLDSLIKTSQTSALTGETIVFNAKDSFACHMDGTYYDHIVLWDFDDGTYSNEPQTGHVFTTPGTYRVSLRVEANDNTLWPNIMYDWSNITITISAPGQPLTANADSENLGGYKGVTGKPIQFYSSATGGKPPYTYYWDFGDCSNTVTEQNPTHVYSTAGTYTVTLTVIDTESNTATDTTTVTVNEPQPLQIDAGGPYTGNTGEKIWFSVTATGGIPPYTFEWDFGDNTPPAHGRSPTHTYKQPGTYTVTVTARDQIGATATGTTEAAVEEGNVEPEDNVKIQSLQGGLGLKATIQAGDVPVDWTITINGKLVFGETQSSGTIPANTVETVKTSRVFGLGPVDITVTANHATKEAEAFMIGPLVLSVKET